MVMFLFNSILQCAFKFILVHIMHLPKGNLKIDEDQWLINGHIGYKAGYCMDYCKQGCLVFSLRAVQHVARGSVLPNF